MFIDIVNNKISLKLENGDDFQQLIAKIKLNLCPYSYDVDLKLWFTEKMNLLVIPEIFQDVKLSQKCKELLIRQKEHILQLKIDKTLPYEKRIELLKEATLFPHQKTGINYLLKYTSSGLFDDPGLGKTLTVISTLCILFHDKKIDKVVVFCPNGLKYNWVEELEMFSSLSYHVSNGDREERTEQLKIDKQVLIINYESLGIKKNKQKKSEKKKSQLIAEKFQKEFTKYITNNTCLVLDEAHRIKTGTSNISKYIRHIGKLTIYKYALTGTPIANKPEDAFYLMNFLDGGKLLGTNYYNFLKQYCILGDSFNEWAIVGYKNLDKLKFLIELKSIRRIKSEVLNLPSRIFQDRIIELSSEHLNHYKEIKKNFSKIIKEGDRILIESCLIKLIQCSSNPLLTESKIESSKIKELDNILDEHIDRGNKKIIVWTNFVENYNFLLKRYEKYKPIFIKGGVSPEQRQKNVNLFQNDPSVKLILLNPKACKEGITLTSSSTMVYLDRTFDLLEYTQSRDRNFRIGQKENCLVINLIGKNTIDETIAKNLYKKENLANYLHGDIEKLEKQISFKEIAKLVLEF
jgi:SNF2 family DNA or RNA helicase